MVNKYIKGYSTSFVMKEKQVQNMKLLNCDKMAKIKII